MVTYAPRCCLHALQPNNCCYLYCSLLLPRPFLPRPLSSLTHPPLAGSSPFASSPLRPPSVRASTLPATATSSSSSSSSSSMGVDVVSSIPAESAHGGYAKAVIKSPSDEREYELVHLPNGFCALLIHDPKISDNDEEDEDDYDDEEGSSGLDEEDDDDDDDDEDEDDHDGSGSSEGGGHRGHGSESTKKMAAAALAVGVGSFSDPKDAQGLAHFLEHMLFMGSSKFPDENEYDSFLSKHGGSSNAFTDTEYTCYYFEVNHKFLKPALDRFAQFFISPLVKADAMDREVQAIDSEFEGYLQNDDARLSQLQCNTAFEKHPFNCFSWGNRKSLSEPVARGVDMRGKILKMYEDYYHAGRMKLAVISGESLETLKEWVVELFSEVKSGVNKPLEFPWEGPVWEPGKLYRIKSVKDQHFVSVIWPFPCLSSQYMKKPYDYISHLVGHEGAGSLFSLLKLNGWATDLSAGIGEGGFERCSAGYMFNVTIHLTDTGLEKVQEVVGLLYEYIKMLRKIGPQEWVFKELQDMTNMEFRFVEDDHADEYAVNLSTNMHIYPEHHVIYGDYALEEWDPVLTQTLLDLMVPDNMRLDIVSKSFVADNGVQHEPWFNFPYTIETIPADLIKLWANTEVTNSMLHMPVVNEFIPRDFSVKDVEGIEIESPPKLIVDDSSLKLWYKLDKKFRMPRANTYFLISCKGAYESVKASVFAELYVKLLKDALNETLYLANVARLESSVSVAVDKIELKMHGFNEKLPCLALKIAQILKTFVPSANRYEVIKEELIRAYTNTNMKPSKHATYLRIQILKERFFHVEDKKDCLISSSLEELISFIPSLLSQVHIEAFCHGNLLEHEAMEIAMIFKENLVVQPLPDAVEPRERILKLPSCKSLIHNVDAKNSLEENSAIEMYFQLDQDLGSISIRDRAIYDLFETIVSEPWFNELRTKKQLGYSVSSSARMTYRVLGFCFRIVSAKYSPSYLKKRIDEFLDNFQSFLDGMDSSEFEEYVEALIAEKLERDHHLTEETDRLWLQIVERRYIFDINQREAEELKTISKSHVIEWYKKYIWSKSRHVRKLTISVWGSNARADKYSSKDEGVNELIEDIVAFKQNNEYFPPLC